MKKATLALMSIAAILCFAGCSKTADNRVSGSSIENNTEANASMNSTTDTLQNESEPQTSSTYSQSEKANENEPETDNTQIEFKQGFYDSLNPEVSPAQNTGSVMSYDEAMKMITDPANGEFDSYYLVKTIRALSLSDCEELMGWNSWFENSYAIPYEHDRFADYEWFGEKTIYEVDIIKNLITGEDENRKMYSDCLMGYDNYSLLAPQSSNMKGAAVISGCHTSHTMSVCGNIKSMMK